MVSCLALRGLLSGSSLQLNLSPLGLIPSVDRLTCVPHSSPKLSGSHGTFVTRRIGVQRRLTSCRYLPLLCRDDSCPTSVHQNMLASLVFRRKIKGLRVRSCTTAVRASYCSKSARSRVSFQDREAFPLRYGPRGYDMVFAVTICSRSRRTSASATC